MSTGPVPDVLKAVSGGRSADVAIVLGSGLSDLAWSLVGTAPIPYSQIEGMPESTVTGHEGALYVGRVSGNDVLAFAGRVHLYEGYGPPEVTYAVRAAMGAGCRTIILTNAAGATDPDVEVGAPCVISDHLNLTGQNPLTGPNDDRVGPRFLDLSEVYDGGLRKLAREVDPDIREAVYAGLAGPTYETPAEVRMLRSMGAELVGMSTVHEAIAARYLGARVLGISVVSNLAAGINGRPLDHAEVSRAGQKAAERLDTLLRGILERL